MTLRPFPPEARMRWRRLDVPGREEARVQRTEGGWRLTGALEVDEDGVAAVLHYTVDVDLGFTPATNTLPIRRLALAVGETRPVRSAWLRFPELRIEALEQTYTREAERVFRYRALVDGEPFTARLETDAFGRVLRYEGLWEGEPVGAGPAA